LTFHECREKAGLFTTVFQGGAGISCVLVGKRPSAKWAAVKWRAVNWTAVKWRRLNVLYPQQTLPREEAEATNGTIGKEKNATHASSHRCRNARCSNGKRRDCPEHKGIDAKCKGTTFLYFSGARGRCFRGR
ncbi:hypothetical protein M513_10787, partial [Trichuris suis]